MDLNIFLEHTKETEDISLRYDLHTAEIINSSLQLKEEEVLIITDLGAGENMRMAPILSRSYIRNLSLRSNKFHLVLQKPKGGMDSANMEVIESLKSLPDSSVIILSLSNKLGSMGILGKSFRKFCINHGHRFLSSTSLGNITRDMSDTFMSTLRLDYSVLQKEGGRIKALLDKGRLIHVKTDAGTDLKIDISGVEAISNDGEYSAAGRGGNIPSGEVYLYPNGKEGVEGTVVIDGSMRYLKGTKLLSRPLIMKIKEGRAVSIEGSDAYLLEESLLAAERRSKYKENVRLIGEFGIGINPNARLLGSTIVDEKCINTAHIALGSNYWFGGPIRTIFHGDQVFKNPKIYIDGRRLKIYGR